MTVSEKFEIVIIPILGLSVLLMTIAFQSEVAVGRLLLGASALLLLQSLVRDLWLLSKNRDADKLRPQKQARCMCVESTVGIAGILMGAMLLGLGIDWSIEMTGWGWAILMVVVLGVGFGVKDFIFEWNPWRIRRDKDHINIVFTWKA